MATVMIRCPMTGQPVSTAIETEPLIFQKLPEVEARMNCPLCGGVHTWTMRDAWLEEASLVPRNPDET